LGSWIYFLSGNVKEALKIFTLSIGADGGLWTLLHFRQLVQEISGGLWSKVVFALTG